MNNKGSTPGGDIKKPGQGCILNSYILLSEEEDPVF